MLAYYVHHFSPFIFELWHGVGIRWYGAAYALGALCGYWLLCWMARHGYSELPEKELADFITYTVLFGVFLGGRVGYILFYDGIDRIFEDPLRFFRVWEGGMASHGGILGIVFFTLWFSLRRRVTWTGLGDNLCVAATIGLFFGRLANFVNGELFGRIASVPWAMQFPKELYDAPALADKAILACMVKIDPHLNTVEAVVDASRTSAPVRAALAEILNPRHPSQLYEASLEGVALFTCLWLIRTKTRAPEGVTTGAFFLLYALFRILGENFREPDSGVPFTLGLTRGQFLSLFMIAIGAAFIVVGFVRNRPAPRPARGDSNLNQGKAV